MSDRLEAVIPCEHDELQEHRLTGPASTSSQGSRWCPGGRRVVLVKTQPELVGSQNVWHCRNCGDDHGGEGCDNPDFHNYNLYRFPNDAVGDLWEIQE